MRWQKPARIGVAIVAVAFAVVVATNTKRRTTPRAEPPLPGADPTALVESEGGNTVRISGARQDGTLAYDRLLTYASGASKMIGVTITSERGGKTFVVKGREGQVGANDSNVQLTGGVRMESSDGLVVASDEASYIKADNIIRVPGAATFTRGRMTGSGNGLDYDQVQDVLRIAESAAIDVTPDAGGAGGMTMHAASLEFNRAVKVVRLDRNVTITRDRQTLAADQAIAHLSEDEQRLELLELRNNSSIKAAANTPGGLESASGRNMDLQYGGEKSALQRAAIDGDGALQLAGDRRQPGRKIAAAIMTLGLAPDGATLTALTARDNVRVTLPGETGTPSRTIAAQSLDSTGDEKQGLTGARFVGNVQFSERGAGVDRAARSGMLDVAMAGGFGAIEDATFTRGVRFEDGTLYATAATGRYAVSRGVLDLSGSEPASPVPHVLNEQIAVDATQIGITLDGPVMQATGAVKSVLQPRKPGTSKDTAAHLPSMLKNDQPVNVTAERLTYDGPGAKAVYEGSVLLWQAETSIKGSAMTIDSKSGDLAADGPVATSAMMLQDDTKGGKERVSSIGTAKAFAYLDSLRRATYTGDAHLTGPQGDLTSPRIELFLKPSGDELERAEAYESVALRGDNRKTTGQRLTYFGADERYLVTGAPVTIVDECARETTGRTLTFYRATDRIVVDGNEQIRTQTRSSSTCP
ncbi:MAG: LptA/OstA family protein [Vicinamibacterales bacterium]